MEDQACAGPERRLPLRLVEMRYEDRGWLHKFFTVYSQKNFAAEPSVFLGLGESSGWDMTPDEALLLAHELVLAAEQIKAAKA